MNETLQTIMTRRSIRKFTDCPIEEEKLEQILRAAIHAPSGMGKDTWQFTVVTNREKIKKLADTIAEVLNREGYNMYQPQALIIPSNLEESPWGKEDNACALENIFLSAHALGIGSVWLNQLQGICHEPKIRELLTSFGIPENHVVYGLAALGYAAEEAKEKVRHGNVVWVK